MMSNDEAILRRLGLVLESDPEADSFPDDERTSFTVEDIAVNLAEAMEEVRREPRTSLWRSFWDRLTEGGEAPGWPFEDDEPPHLVAGDGPPARVSEELRERRAEEHRRLVAERQLAAEAREALELAIRGALWDLRPTKAKEKALFRLLRDVLRAVAAALSAREETEAPPSNRGDESQ